MPNRRRRTRRFDGSTRTSMKLQNYGATLVSNAAASHSTENGQTPKCPVHHEAGPFHRGVVGSNLATTAVVFG
jgi:hypothetical protein